MSELRGRPAHHALAPDRLVAVLERCEPATLAEARALPLAVRVPADDLRAAWGRYNDDCGRGWN